MLSEAEIMKQPAKPDVLFGRICSSNQLSCTCAICKHRLLARTPAKRNIVNCENPPSGGMVIVKLVTIVREVVSIDKAYERIIRARDGRVLFVHQLFISSAFHVR